MESPNTNGPADTFMLPSLRAVSPPMSGETGEVYPGSGDALRESLIQNSKAASWVLMIVSIYNFSKQLHSIVFVLLVCLRQKA